MKMAVPAKYSINQADYDPELARHLLISLDYAEQARVVSYDCEAGLLTRLATDAKGEPVVEGEGFKCETFRGIVQVEWKE